VSVIDSARWLRRLAMGAVVMTAAAGCASLGAGPRGINHNDLISDLASQLEQSSTLTYSARYQLAGGAVATIVQAQQPLRSAYLYPGGRVTVTSDATTECSTDRKLFTCTLTAPPSPVSSPPATLFAGAGRQGMITPSEVLSLLNAAALDADADVQQHDTTIAGRHATCVDVQKIDNAPSARFNACITSEGVLGSFTGRVDGADLDIAMTRYQNTFEGDVFDPPPAAKDVDRR
jgi:hypothetical protein